MSTLTLTSKIANSIWRTTATAIKVTLTALAIQLYRLYHANKSQAAIADGRPGVENGLPVGCNRQTIIFFSSPCLSLKSRFVALEREEDGARGPASSR